MNISRRCIALGAITAVFGAFPAAALTALGFRFPIPFGGYASGVEAVGPALLAVVFYGLVTGGFVVLPCLGAAVGYFAARFAGPDGSTVFRLTIASALMVDLAATMTLALWDKIYGPW